MIPVSIILGIDRGQACLAADFISAELGGPVNKVINEIPTDPLNLDSESPQHRQGFLKSGLARTASQISQQLLSARTTATALSDFPGSPPEHLKDAYNIQSASLEQWPDGVAGWKVGGIPEGLRNELGVDWLVGPIFDRSVKRADENESIEMPVFNGGFAAIEPELVVCLGNSRSEDRIFIGAEIASSPVPAINDHGPTAVVCDFGNNNGLLVGGEIVDWQHIDEPLEVSIWIDDSLIATKMLGALAEHASPALQFCLDHAAQQGRELAPGTFVSTGAITGIHEASIGAKSKISFGKWGMLRLHLTQAERLTLENQSVQRC